MANVYYNDSKVAGGANKYLDPRVSEMPTPSEDLEGEVVQYVGETSNYTNGLFYKCKNSIWKPLTADIYTGMHDNTYIDAVDGLTYILEQGYIKAISNSKTTSYCYVDFSVQNNRMVNLSLTFRTSTGTNKNFVQGWQPEPLWYLPSECSDYFPSKDFISTVCISYLGQWNTICKVGTDGSINIFSLITTDNNKTFGFDLQATYDLTW